MNSSPVAVSKARRHAVYVTKTTSPPVSPWLDRKRRNGELKLESHGLTRTPTKSGQGPYGRNRSGRDEEECEHVRIFATLFDSRFDSNVNIEGIMASHATPSICNVKLLANRTKPDASEFPCSMPFQRGYVSERTNVKVACVITAAGDYLWLMIIIERKIALNGTREKVTIVPVAGMLYGKW